MAESILSRNSIGNENIQIRLSFTVQPLIIRIFTTIVRLLVNTARIQLKRKTGLYSQLKMYSVITALNIRANIL